MAGPYRMVAHGDPVGEGVGDSIYVSIQAVAKANGPRVPYCIPNELISLEIGRFLGLPIPPGGIVRSRTTADPLFASLDFNLAGDSLPPIDPAECVAQLPELSAGILLFDALIGNCDRHTGNLAMDTSAAPPRLNLFDHSHALFGAIPEQGSERLAQIRDRLGLTPGEWTGVTRHCLLPEIQSDDHFGTWLDRIGRLPDFLIENACRSAVDLGITADQAESAVDFLRHRRDHLRQIIDNSRSDFLRIDQWSLLP